MSEKAVGIRNGYGLEKGTDTESNVSECGKRLEKGKGREIRRGKKKG